MGIVKEKTVIAKRSLPVRIFLCLIDLTPTTKVILKVLLNRAGFFNGPQPIPYRPFEELRLRSDRYPVLPVDGQFSILTTVYDTPKGYFKILIDSILNLDGFAQSEWIVLNNGSTASDTLDLLDGLKRFANIKVIEVKNNIGIIPGMKLCLEKASGQFIIPADSDDFVFPDALRVFATEISKHPTTQVFFSDEDKLVEGRFGDPYRKIAWDPVLFMNSCYIAHLCAIHRKSAIELGAYSDPLTNGSHDWDTFVRFVSQGRKPRHIPEILYSWRIHSLSTAGNMDSKSYIHDSQMSVLSRFLKQKNLDADFRIEYSPSFRGNPDWRIRRKEQNPRSFQIVFRSETMIEEIPRLIPKSGLNEYFRYPLASEHLNMSLATPLNVAISSLNKSAADCFLFINSLLKFVSEDCVWEIHGLRDIFPETLAVGGLILDRVGDVVCATAHNSDPLLAVPRRAEHPGYHARNRKIHTVENMAFDLLVVDKEKLLHCLSLSQSQNWGQFETEFSILAKKSNFRMIFSPFVIGQS